MDRITSRAGVAPLPLNFIRNFYYRLFAHFKRLRRDTGCLTGLMGCGYFEIRVLNCMTSPSPDPK